MSDCQNDIQLPSRERFNHISEVMMDMETEWLMLFVAIAEMAV